MENASISDNLPILFAQCGHETSAGIPIRNNRMQLAGKMFTDFMRIHGHDPFITLCYVLSTTAGITPCYPYLVHSTLTY